jgi:hypothetical protein
LKIVNYVLGSVFAVLFCVACVQLIRLFRGTKTPCSFAAKKIFHAILVLVLAVRAPFFIMFPQFEFFPQTVLWVLLAWNHLAETLFVSAYFILLLFWVDFLSMLTGKDSQFFARRFWLIALFVTAIVLMNIGLLVVGPILSLPGRPEKQFTQDLADWDAIWELLNCAWFVAMSFGFAYYGYKLYHEMVQHNALGIKLKGTGARSIITIGVLCTACFLLQAVAGVISSIQEIILVHRKSTSELTSFTFPWWGVLIYYSYSEILPTILMLILLGHLPKKTSIYHRGVSTTLGTFLTIDRPYSHHYSSYQRFSST